ncbi:MAG: 5'-nucleotidase C-terminal domain-containing protein [Spirochaetales bacterium]|nr:5'-nucleotidase C-terminal domain-containing protein [Spirochaetales bacterium]
MKNLFKVLMLVSLVAVFLGCATSPISMPDVEHNLVILHTNDYHGHPSAFYDYPAGGQGGLPAQATYVNDVRAANPNVLVLSAGDLNTGRPESNFFKAEPDIIGHNFIGYDALTMGNHEFDPDFDAMQKQIADSNFPWLCANVVNEDGSYIENVLPYIIKDYGDFKVAILGLMDAGTVKTGSPANIERYTFRNEVEVANELVPMLKEQADIVIALVHMGLYPELTEGSKAVAAQVPGLALVIDGHTHTKLEEPVMVKNEVTGKDVAIVQARHWGLYMGNASLSFMNGEVTGLDWKLDPINVQYREKLDDGTRVYHFVGEELKEDAALAALIQPFVDKVDAVLNEVIGTATAPFLNDDTRKVETAIGDMVADSMLWYANSMNLGADFAFQNGGGIRTSIADGEIMKRTIYEVLPFDNTVMTVTMKGSDVIALFDYTPETVTHGAMPQVSEGVSFVIDVAAGTISDVLINGAAIDPGKEYVIATNSYLASGGDGYKMFKNKVAEYDSSLMQRDAFIDYIEFLGGTITPDVKGRYVIK